MKTQSIKRLKIPILALMVATALCLLISGCDKKTQDGTSKKTYKIGVSLVHVQDIFMKNLESGCLKEAAKYPNVELKLVEATSDPVKQLGQVEQFIAEKVDIIVLNPVNLESSVTAIEAAVEAGIPIFTVNTTSTPEAQAKCVTYVGSDATESGRIQGRYVAETVLNGSGRVAYMHAAMGHEAQINRHKGTLEIFNNYPEIKIVLEGAGDWRTDKAIQLTENWIQSGVPFDIIVSQSADMAYGSLLVVKDAGLLDKIKISGIDITDDTAKELVAGNLTNLVFQDAIGQGEGAIRTAVAILNGESVPKMVDIPYELVTKENASNYVGRY